MSVVVGVWVCYGRMRGGEIGAEVGGSACWPGWLF